MIGRESGNRSTKREEGDTIEDFGTPDEVKEMARPIRSAHNRQEAPDILRF
ncbi:hypothetical protein AGMMS49944_10710 [Spirochaetia bacterium]|nr:hypothetical protein AGMMS49944_10710 [Spirochaetia bacterium]